MTTHVKGGVSLGRYLLRNRGICYVQAETGNFTRDL